MTLIADPMHPRSVLSCLFTVSKEEVNVADTPVKNFCQIMRCMYTPDHNKRFNTHLLYKQPELSTAPPSCRNWKWSLEMYVSRKLIIAFRRL